MKSLLKIFMVILLFGVPLGASATTRYVSAYGAGQYTTINAAYSASVSGDTILIGPGNYSEADMYSQRRLTWLGAGWDQSKVAFSGQFTQSTNSGGTVLEGLRIETVSGIRIGNGIDSVTYRRCFLKSTGTYGSALQANGGRVYIEDCILVEAYSTATVQTPNAAALFRDCIFVFAGTTTSACLWSSTGLAGTLEIYNCVFLNYGQIFSLANGSQPVIAVNNLFYDWRSSPTFGTYPGTSTFDYNASQTITAPGTNTISITSNPFVNYNETNNFQEGTSDLHLVVGSGLIDTGHPSLVDVDSTRSDFGVYGGPHPLVDNGIPAYPWVVNLNLTPNLVGQGTDVNVTAIGRIGPQY